MARRSNEIETVEEVQKTFFPGCELEQVEENPIFEYNHIDISDLEDDEEYTGNPELSEIETYTFDDDGVEKTQHRLHLRLVDEEEEEYLDIRINLKKADDIQQRVHHKSKLYALCTGIMELENPGCTQGMNSIKTVNIGEFRKFINELTEMTVRIKTEYSTNFTYNSFIVTDVQI